MIGMTASFGVISSGMEQRYSDPGNVAVKPTVYEPAIEFCELNTSMITWPIVVLSVTKLGLFTIEL